MHSRENPLRIKRPAYYITDPWGLEPAEPSMWRQVAIEVIIVPAGAHAKKLRLEFVNILTPTVLGKPIPARPKTKEQSTYLLEFVNRFIEHHITCDCCQGRELMPISMQQVCWNNE